MNIKWPVIQVFWLMFQTQIAFDKYSKALKPSFLSPLTPHSLKTQSVLSIKILNQASFKAQSL